MLLYSFVYRLADNLPAATVFRNLKTGELQYEDGYKLGFKHQTRTILNNHLTIVINYHPITRSVDISSPANSLMDICRECRFASTLLTNDVDQEY